MPLPPSALEIATKLLAGRDKTRAQLVQALEKKGFGAEDIEATCARLRSLGYLDDARVAARRARDDLIDGWAPDAIVHRLQAVGLDEAVARAAADAIAAELDWSAAASAQALLDRRRLTGAKAARFLASRGFDEDTIAALVELGSAPP